MSGEEIFDTDGDAMNGHKEIGVEWARSQVEAFADGSLRGKQRARMQDLLGQNPEVALEVERARALRAALRRMGGHHVPGGLRGRLLGIARPRGSSWRMFAAPAVGGFAALLLALIAFWQTSPRQTAQLPRPVAQADVEQAIDEFNLAMRYLRVGAERSREQLDDALRFSVRLAMTAGHEAMQERSLEHRESERNGERP